MHYGYIKIATAIPNLTVANCGYNIERIEVMMRQAENQDAQIVCFPELCITAYTCGDLFHQQALIEEAETALHNLLDKTQNLDIISIVGMPVKSRDRLFNCGIVIQKGKILAVVPKTHLPNYHEFYEKRWFTSSLHALDENIILAGQKVPFGTQLLIGTTTFRFGIEICEDLWVTIPPSSLHTLSGAHLIFNLSASNETIGKNEYIKSLIAQQSARCISGYVYVSSGFGESTQDVVFAGKSIFAENGKIITESERFLIDEQLTISEIDIDLLKNERQMNSSFTQDGFSLFDSTPKYRLIDCEILSSKAFHLTRPYSPTPFIPAGPVLDARCEEILAIQITGLVQRINHTKLTKAVIGISGGLDSTLALLVTTLAFDKLSIPRENIIGVTMPGFGTTSRTLNNAKQLMKSLQCSIREIDITEASLLHFKDLDHNPEIHDVTYENTQARERTQLLMDIANKENGLVIGTGDLSELALGWCTYNGDHMSMYAVNSGVPKTLVKYLVQWAANHKMNQNSALTLKDILNTPVSPELLPKNEQDDITQKTEEIIGPYELHDFFLYYMIRYGFRPNKIRFLATQAFHNKYSAADIQKWLTLFINRFFSQQFKRSCMPDGPKVGTINLSPRGDWRMPSDADKTLWMEIDR
ncbi:NAD(+) synthase [Microbacter margulisiae]|nr:NAD(+) synthase [Microbacter margulisiae]